MATVIALALPMAPAVAQDAAAKGFQIAAQADRSDRGFGDSHVELKMILRNASGKSSTRVLEITTLELPDEKIGDKSMILFSSPGDIDGTALLSHARILEPDNQWLYLPALKRTKRISSKNKSGPFVGSEFAFEDITGQELRKYEYTWLRSEKCGALTCDVVERRPLYSNSGYKRQIGWVDQKYHQARKLQYYDRRGALLKTQTFDDYKLYNKRYWRAQVQKMVNHQTGKSTELRFGPFRFNVGLKDRDFVKGALDRLG
jgi:outer membrane lipoprotein-sorting protein